MKKTSFAAVGIALLAALASGCATRQSAPPPQYSQAGHYQGTQYGVVQNIETVRAQSQTSGGGAIVGGVVGGLLGHQVDHGARKDLATGVGVVAGALIGNEIEKNNRGARDIYRVTVQTERGGMRSFDYASLNDLRVGDRVRIENNQLYRW
jgi:outer membrane lipoprotein SlyB